MLSKHFDKFRFQIQTIMDSEEDSGEMTEILQLVDNIFQNLDVVVEAEDIAFVQSEEFYLQILEIIFSDHVQEFEEFKEYFENKSPGENIQLLIDFLSQSVMGVELSHINGEEIANGNRQHILNLLQLIHELSLMKNGELTETGNEEEEVGKEPGEVHEGEEENAEASSQNERNHQFYEEEEEGHGEEGAMFDNGAFAEIEEVSQESSHNTNEKGRVSSTKKTNKLNEEGLNQRSNSTQEHRRPNLGGNEEESDRKEEQIEKEDSNDHGEEGEGEGENGEEGTREGVEFHQEPIENFIEPDSDMEEVPGVHGNPRMAQNPTRETKKQTKKSSTVLNGRSKKKEMEQKLIGKQQHRFLTTKPEKLKRTTPKNLRPSSAIDFRAGESLKKTRKPGVNELVAQEDGKNSRKSLNEEGMPKKTSSNRASQASSQREESRTNSPSRILEDPELLRRFLQSKIKEERSRLASKLHVPLQNDDAKTVELLIKNKSKYKNYLRDYIKQHHLVMSQKLGTEFICCWVSQKGLRVFLEQMMKRAEIDMGKVVRRNQKKEKVIQNRSMAMQEQLEREEALMQKRLREDKDKYVNKILKIVFELEKEKIKSERQEFKEKRETKNKETRDALESIENYYKDRINLLKEQLWEERKNRRETQIAQKKVENIQISLKKENEFLRVVFE